MTIKHTLIAFLLFGCSRPPSALMDSGHPLHDMTAPFDFTSVPDLAPVADLADSPDLTPPVDFATPPNLNLRVAESALITYHGGPVITSTPNVYLIWYGDWSSSSTVGIITDLVNGFGGSDYAWILSEYYQLPQGAPDGGQPLGPRQYVTGQLTLAGSYFVGYPRGPSLLGGDVFGIVTDAIAANTVPSDPDGLYLVLTSADVGEALGGFFSGFCGSYCGWHDSGLGIRYAFVGDPGQCPEACTVQDQVAALGYGASPNGNWSADGMASVLIHEVSEMLTDSDPDPSSAAWQDGIGAENGDKCAWRFEPTYKTASSLANVRFGARDFLIQQMWTLDETGGHCGLAP